MRTRTWDALGTQAINYLQFVSSDLTTYSVGIASQSNGQATSVNFNGQFLGMQGYYNQVMQTIGFYELYT